MIFPRDDQHRADAVNDGITFYLVVWFARPIADGRWPPGAAAREAFVGSPAGALENGIRNADRRLPRGRNASPHDDLTSAVDHRERSPVDRASAIELVRNMPEAIRRLDQPGQRVMTVVRSCGGDEDEAVPLLMDEFGRTERTIRRRLEMAPAARERGPFAPSEAAAFLVRVVGPRAGGVPEVGLSFGFSSAPRRPIEQPVCLLLSRLLV